MALATIVTVVRFLDPLVAVGLYTPPVAGAAGAVLAFLLSAPAINESVAAWCGPAAGRAKRRCCSQSGAGVSRRRDKGGDCQRTGQSGTDGKFTHEVPQESEACCPRQAPDR
ncbi:hypothetical protein ACWCQN_28505 [Streptomyces sp. NPDC001984]